MAGTEDAGAKPSPVVAPGATFDPALRELAKRIASAWDRGDLDAWFACMDPGIEHVPILGESGHPKFPGLRDVYRGQEQVRELWDDWHSMYAGKSRLQRVGDVWGNDCYAELGRQRAVGRDDVSATVDVHVAVEVRNGLALRFQAFERWEEALAALDMPTDLSPGPP